MLTLSSEGHGLNPMLGQTKDIKIYCFSTNHAAIRVRAQIGLPRVRMFLAESVFCELKHGKIWLVCLMQDRVPSFRYALFLKMHEIFAAGCLSTLN